MTEMVNSPQASNALVGTDEEWRAVLVAAQELEERVVSLRRRLAAVEKREFACAHQPVPPEVVAGVPFGPVMLEGGWWRRARKPPAKPSGSPGSFGSPA
ncbi:MAG: hypothetical protein ACRDSH_26195 [Pseudonocardiaceae bacterium]